ncbi:hypothetical protein GOP47_0019661 [Adiantum capillus-veneris]|uniref:Uncharacterized protein n=1 Tax=Adiantum capillus-veneris TaxID=13818 RepID=A0A9D4UD67_ADICA|nr:hypothetical protein GOP47_0019661 [Adiantum capillus-veneris]
MRHIKQDANFGFPIATSFFVLFRMEIREKAIVIWDSLLFRQEITDRKLCLGGLTGLRRQCIRCHSGFNLRITEFLSSTDAGERMTFSQAIGFTCK